MFTFCLADSQYSVATNFELLGEKLQSDQNFKSSNNPVFPLKLSASSNRYLVDQTGTPFFWSGDVAWSLVVQLNKEDVIFYLNNRRLKGFSVILMNLIEHKYGDRAPANYYGDFPFSGSLFVSPNEAYFAHVDYVIQEAQKRNILVLLDPLYLGYQDEGWFEEVKSASVNDLYYWGHFLGNRYKIYDNIIWVIGGDKNPLPVKDKLLEMVRGIRETDTLHLMTAHNTPSMTFAITPWEAESWLSVNNVYSYDSTLYPLYKKAYQQSPQMPYFLIESGYENDNNRNSTPVQLRTQVYEAILCGGMGYVFGNCPIWHFGSTSASSYCGGLTDWKHELDNCGSQNIDFLQRLFRSRDWFRLIPDFEHRYLVDGYGEWGRVGYVTAARTYDGNTLIAYLPQSRSVTVDMSSISGKKSKSWWYEPSTGLATVIGIYDNKGLMTFIPPSGDWVLVIDNAELNLPIPETGETLF
jgi:hypothetical protein